MQRRRPAPDAHHLARRFLQLDTDIRLAAAADGLVNSFFQDDRPDSPGRPYVWDSALQHPKPKPAQGPIRIRQLENVAKTKPKPTRSVSDPGDAQSLIARFVRSNEEKSRSMTVAASDPSPASPAPSSSVHSTHASASGSTARVFPFPSIMGRTTLENFIEMESSANETNKEDPLALKMGQILARRAAAATRSISRRSQRSSQRSSRSSSRAGFGGVTLSDLEKEINVQGEGEQGKAARPRPPLLDVGTAAGKSAHGHSKRESVVIDDRSPHDGQPLWMRTNIVAAAAAASSTNVTGSTITDAMNPSTSQTMDASTTRPIDASTSRHIPDSIGPRNERERNESFSASRDSLRSFVFPAIAPLAQPESGLVEPELETVMEVQVHSPVRTQFALQAQTPVRAQFQVQTRPLHGQPQTPNRAHQPQTPIRGQPQTPIRGQPQTPVRGQPQTPIRGYPLTPIHGQAQTSPVQMRTPIRIQTQVRPVSFVVQASPSSGVYVSPVESVNWATPVGGGPAASPTGYRASPTVANRASSSVGYRASPMAGYRDSSTHRASASDAHVNLLRGLSPMPSHGLPLPAPNRPHSFNLLDRTGANAPRRFSVHFPPPENAQPAPRPPSPVVIAPPPKTPSPPATTSSPPRQRVPSPRASPGPIASPSPLPTRVPSPARQVFPTYSPDLVPSRALSPLPPRLRHHTNASSHPSDGSGSDEVVFSGKSSSASSTPAKRRRNRTRRPHMRVNSDGLVRRTMSEGVRSKRASDGGGYRLSEVRRTGQALMRRSLTGGVDGGEVSSDGRDVVLFVPRGPPPPVPKIPTPPIIKAPTPPAIKAPTPPAVVVDATAVRAAPVPPPLVRKESIPLPEASPYPGAAPPLPVATQVQSAEASTKPLEPVRKPSFEPLQGPIIEPPAEPRQLAHLPWSPPARLRRPEVISREGSFHTAHDSFVEDRGIDTDAEFPSSVPGSFPDVSYMDDAQRDRVYQSTPVHMSRSDLDEGESAMHSAEDDTAPRRGVTERATISSAMRGHVAQPSILTRQSSGEFIAIPVAPTPPRSATPARRPGRRPAEGVLSGVFQQGFLVPPLPMPSPPSSGDSHTPHSPSNAHGRAVTASIPMRHDDYSPPRLEQLPRSVTPRTEVSVCHPDDESFHSTHTADEVFRLPLDDWIEFAMSSMAAMGVPLTRSAFQDFHESEGEGVAAMSEVISASSMRGFPSDDSGGLLDGVSQADEDSGDSLSRSLSDVGTPPSARSSPDNSGLFSSAQYAGMTTMSSVPPESTGTRPTIRTDLGYSPEHNQPVMTAVSTTTADESESERAVESLQNIATVVREMNLHTPIPSASSSRPLHSASTSLQMHTPFSGPGSNVDPPSFVGPPPTPGAFRDSYPARALSPGSVSITFRESTPTSSSVPPLVVQPEDRDRFADSLLMAEYQHQRSFQHLRDDDYRALDDGEDVVLYGVGEEWERVEGRIRTESDGTNGSGVPIEMPDYDPNSDDPQAHRKYTQFLISFANALRTPGVNRPQRWVEVALRTLRGNASGTRPRYPSSLYDAISRAEAGIEVPPVQPIVPGTLSSTFVTSSSASTPKSSSIGSALPENDEIVEDYIRQLLPSAPPTPQSVAPIQTDVASTNAIPWPALASPVAPRYILPPAPSSETSRSHVSSLTSQSGYSSLIPPPPRVRPRSIEPHWLAIYMARRWAFTQNHASRRTYSSPSALGPPMPYHWRPICHISPERLWEITNLAVRADMPPPPPPPALSNVESVSPVELTRPHYTTPATTYGRATPYSIRTASSLRSRRTTTPVQRPLSALATVAESASRMTSHPNLPINLSHHSIPPPIPTSASRMNLPLIQRPLDSHYTPRSSTSSDRPAPTSTAVVTPAAMVQRKRTVRDFVGRLVGKERTRVRSISSRTRTPSPLVKPRFGVAGRIVEGVRRAFRYPRRRTRVTSIRSQRTQM